MPQIQNVFAIVGFSIIDGVNEPNTAFVVPTLKPFADRAGAANSAQALIARVFAEGQQVRTATVIPSTCLRSSACRPPAGSNTSSKGSRDRSPRR